MVENFWSALYFQLPVQLLKISSQHVELNLCALKK